MTKAEAVALNAKIAAREGYPLAITKRAFDPDRLPPAKTDRNKYLLSAAASYVGDESEGAELTDEDFYGRVPQPLPEVGQPVERGIIYHESESGEYWFCSQSHTRTHHKIDTIPDLFSRARQVGQAWEQRTGGQDLYQVGDTVTHDGKNWESTVDNNSWKPGVYGWDEIS